MNRIHQKLLCMLGILLINLLFMQTALAASEMNADVVSSFNGFTFDLYKQLNQKQNLIASPYSLSSLLAILAAGASGDTRTQLLGALHLSKQTNDQFLNFLTLQPISSQLLIANALWAKKDFHYQADFLAKLKPINTVNFYPISFADPVNASHIINGWVSQKTQGKITDLIPAEAISDTTQLILTNAIYFKGDWLNPFKPTLTQQMPFYKEDNSKQMTAMMQQEDSFKYGENDQAQFLQLPYAKSDLAMVVFLPKSQHPLQEITRLITNENFQTLLQTSREVPVNVYLPKFKLAVSFSDLVQSLQKLGITTAFSSQANFSNLTHDPIAISDVIQKAMIEVDEKGTTAAAASGIVMATTAMAPGKQEPPKIFRADHPFMFLIYDTKTKIILFVGQVINPGT